MKSEKEKQLLTSETLVIIRLEHTAVIPDIIMKPVPIDKDAS